MLLFFFITCMLCGLGILFILWRYDRMNREIWRDYELVPKGWLVTDISLENLPEGYWNVDLMCPLNGEKPEVEISLKDGVVRKFEEGMS
jgi:hypothetical protein